MIALRGIVYDPPAAALPHVAIVFREDGSVLRAEAVPSYDAGEKLLAAIMDQSNAAEGKERFAIG